ncbi:MAG TPA: hypothetical protein VIX20_03345 [Ktedonobacteraceae bacterium]
MNAGWGRLRRLGPLHHHPFCATTCVALAELPISPHFVEEPFPGSFK